MQEIGDIFDYWHIEKLPYTKIFELKFCKSHTTWCRSFTSDLYQASLERPSFRCL